MTRHILDFQLVYFACSKHILRKEWTRMQHHRMRQATWQQKGCSNCRCCRCVASRQGQQLTTCSHTGLRSPDWLRLAIKKRLKVTDHTGMCDRPVITPKCLAIDAVNICLPHKLSISVYRHPVLAHLIDSEALRMWLYNWKTEEWATDSQQSLFEVSDHLRPTWSQDTWLCNLFKSLVWMSP